MRCFRHPSEGLETACSCGIHSEPASLVRQIACKWKGKSCGMLGQPNRPWGELWFLFLPSNRAFGPYGRGESLEAVSKGTGHGPGWVRGLLKAYFEGGVEALEDWEYGRPRKKSKDDSLHSSQYPRQLAVTGVRKGGAAFPVTSIPPKDPSGIPEVTGYSGNAPPPRFSTPPCLACQDREHPPRSSFGHERSPHIFSRHGRAISAQHGPWRVKVFHDPKISRIL